MSGGYTPGTHVGALWADAERTADELGYLQGTQTYADFVVAEFDRLCDLKIAPRPAPAANITRTLILTALALMLAALCLWALIGDPEWANVRLATPTQASETLFGDAK